jgi:nucleoside-diphosphate-sugar epimerase
MKQHILIFGAGGFVGGGVARHLSATGHRVRGVTRSAESAARLNAASIAPIVGDLDERLSDLVAATEEADAIIFAAQLRPDAEHRAVSALLDAIADTNKRFIFTSGTGVFLQRTGGAWSQDSFAEEDVFVPEPLAARRIEVENLVREASNRNIHGIVIRPPLIWGPGDHGHVAMTYRSAAATGAACYVGEGLASYSNVHVEDIARLYALALERGEAGALYHGVGGEIPNRWVAEAVARDLGCEARSVSVEEAKAIWGEFGALIMASSSRSRSPRARDELGWTAERTDMLTMIGEPRLKSLAESAPPHA